MQGRVDEPDGHRKPVHRLQDLGEVLALQRQQLVQRRLSFGLVVSEDQLLDQLAPGHRGTCARYGTGRPRRRRTYEPARRPRGVGVRPDTGGVPGRRAPARGNGRDRPCLVLADGAVEAGAPGSRTGTAPSKTSPVAPSIETGSPSAGWCARRPGLASSTSISSPRHRTHRCAPSRAPPQPRARCCRRGGQHPRAASMPWRSSGPSRGGPARRLTAGSPCRRRGGRRRPGRAAPGEALTPVIGARRPVGRKRGNISWASWAP